MDEKTTTLIDALSEKLKSFVDQYEIDMRGDKRLDNGNCGVIGEIREIKQILTDYPSLLWLMAHQPLKTTGTLILLLIVFQLIWEHIPEVFQALGVGP
jgi:hypothetical protein